MTLECILTRQIVPGYLLLSLAHRKGRHFQRFGHTFMHLQHGATKMCRTPLCITYIVSNLNSSSSVFTCDDVRFGTHPGLATAVHNHNCCSLVALDDQLLDLINTSIEISSGIASQDGEHPLKQMSNEIIG